MIFIDKCYNIYGMKNEIRQPQQERSTEKKNKIIRASYEVFSEIGYYSTNTSEIAKRAGVSTGIIYSYFKDKRDILLYVLKIYIDEVSAPVIKLAEALTAPIDLEKWVPMFIDKAISTHKRNAHLHNTLHALAVSDEDVNQEFIALEDSITRSIADKLRALGYAEDNTEERVHLAMNAVQSFSHECVYDKHQYLDYDAMRSLVTRMVVDLFN